MAGAVCCGPVFVVLGVWCVTLCVGASAQLAEVFWVEGLGPSKELWMADADGSTGTDLDGVDDHTHGPAAGAAGTHVGNSSFADQVGLGDIWCIATFGL